MNDKDFSEIIACFKEAREIKSEGSKTDSKIDPPVIKAIRTKLQVTQKEFALMIGVSLPLLQSWERGKREPEGPAKSLLLRAAKNPEAVLDSLRH